MKLYNSLQSQPAKPFSQSCEENKHVILEKIQPYLANKSSLLEIASGTGQHAIYFAKYMRHLNWQTSDLIESHPGICQWLAEADLENIQQPLELNVSHAEHWPTEKFEALFSANSFHIMSKSNVEDFFKHLPKVMQKQTTLLVYGPFNYQGEFTSDSNARFDEWLKQRNPESGIKDFEWCNALAESAGLKLIDDIAMPQNNRILVWQTL